MLNVNIYRVVRCLSFVKSQWANWKRVCALRNLCFRASVEAAHAFLVKGEVSRRCACVHLEAQFQLATLLQDFRRPLTLERLLCLMQVLVSTPV